MGPVLLQVLRIGQIWTGSAKQINGLQRNRKGLVAHSEPWLSYAVSKGARP